MCEKKFVFKSSVLDDDGVLVVVAIIIVAVNIVLKQFSFLRLA